MMNGVRVPVDPVEAAHQLCDLLREYPGDRERVDRVLRDGMELPGLGGRTAPVAVAVPDIVGGMPGTVLGAVGQSGMVLADGYVCVLAAEGGIGKSSLVGSVALECAMGGGGEVFGIFSGMGGPVMVVTYEDSAVVAKWRLEGLAQAMDEERGGSEARDALRSVYVMDMESWPLYGPADTASYQSRPVPLQGWEVLWREVERVQPVLLVIDPVLKGYVGESNGTSPVREFLGSLRHRLRLVCRNGAGVLVTAHSTKTARGSRGAGQVQNPMDPGHVAGSAAWVDEPRGVLTMTWGEDGSRMLSVVKANLGPSRIMLKLRAVRQPDGAVLGFVGEDGWHAGWEVGDGEDAAGDGNGRGGNGHGRSGNGKNGRNRSAARAESPGGFDFEGIAG